MRTRLQALHSRLAQQARVPRVETALLAAPMSTSAANALPPARLVLAKGGREGTFEIPVGPAADIAKIEFEIQDGVLDILHTVTPPAARGKGVAGLLADAAFAYAREHKYAVRPSCTYISGTWLPKNGASAGFRVDAASGLAIAAPSSTAAAAQL